MVDKSSIGKRCVLIIDDEPDICELARITLEEDNYDVLVAYSGDQGLALFQENSEKIKLVLLDLAMKGKTGLEVLDHINALNSTIPIIIMSGYVSSKSEAVNLGALDVLKKPFRLIELEEVVAENLR